MKKVLLIALIAAFTLPAMSQGKKYKKAMLSAIEQMKDAPDDNARLALAGTFEELAEQYPEQWLPSYYASKILIDGSFNAPDGKSSDVHLDRAKRSLDRAMKLVPEESEVHAMKALYFIGIISADPDTRGQIYYQDAMDAISTAESLNPENPRAILLDGMMTINIPEFLGGGPEAAKPLFLEAEEKYLAFENDDPLWPSWGADLAKDNLERLKDIPAE